jgi:hypothetical protein
MHIHVCIDTQKNVMHVHVYIFTERPVYTQYTCIYVLYICIYNISYMYTC